MTQDHLSLLLEAANATQDAQGWQRLPEQHHISLYVASGGGALTVSRVDALRSNGDFLEARTTRGELFVLALEQVFAGAVEGATSAQRKAGFV